MAIEIRSEPIIQLKNPPPPADLYLGIEGAMIKWPNFRGEKTMYRAPGIRTFNIFLDEETAQAMKNHGWNVKWKTRKPEFDDPNLPTQAHIEVFVGYKFKPPTVGLATSRGTMNLGPAEFKDGDEVYDTNNIGILDGIDFAAANVVVRGRRWGPNAAGESGIKAWLVELYVLQEESTFAQQFNSMARLEDTGAVPEMPLALQGGQNPGDDDIVDAEIVED